MGEHVSVEYGHHVRIDVRGWVAHRVGDEHTDLTGALREFGQVDEQTSYPARDWMTRAELWCTAREYPLVEGFPVTHDHPWLSREVSVVLAYAGGLGPIAVVSIEGATPSVYADLTTDESYWQQVASVDVVCPCGRRWTWHDSELVTPDGQATTITAVFGDHPDAPFTPCPDCVAYDNDHTDAMCPNPGTDVIICPACGQRCDLELTAAATVPQRRPFAVHISEAIEYHGWVLAVDPDDADERARHLLDSDGQDRDPSVGHLEVVHLDREILANDAGRVCWQCRTDPRQPNPACPHPPPAANAEHETPRDASGAGTRP